MLPQTEKQTNEMKRDVYKRQIMYNINKLVEIKKGHQVNDALSSLNQ